MDTSKKTFSSFFVFSICSNLAKTDWVLSKRANIIKKQPLLHFFHDFIPIKNFYKKDNI